jgi:hypothetical protein
MPTPLVKTPKDMDELTELIKDMRGSQSDLAQVAIMAMQLGWKRGWNDSESMRNE